MNCSPSDYKAAADFYSALFGWEKNERVRHGPDGHLLHLRHNGIQLAGMFTGRPERLAGFPNWLGPIFPPSPEESRRMPSEGQGRRRNADSMADWKWPGGDDRTNAAIQSRRQAFHRSI